MLQVTRRATPAARTSITAVHGVVLVHESVEVDCGLLLIVHLDALALGMHPLVALIAPNHLLTYLFVALVGLLP